MPASTTDDFLILTVGDDNVVSAERYASAIGPQVMGTASHQIATLRHMY